MSDSVRLGPWQTVPGGRERRAANTDHRLRVDALGWILCGPGIAYYSVHGSELGACGEDQAEDAARARGWILEKSNATP